MFLQSLPSYEHGCEVTEPMRRGNKFNAVATVIDGVRFDSKKEAGRYVDLKLLQRAGKISGLTVDKKLLRYPFVVNGIKVCTYVADFRYVENGVEVIEDVKGNATAGLSMFKAKKALMKACYNIDVRVIN